jgi:23S rRNA pseudouridine2605 synthase
MVRAGRVSVDGRVQLDPERPTDSQLEQIAVDGETVGAVRRMYLALNKPRGVIVSAADEQDRETIYPLIASADAPWLAPVGRLDRASEGLLLVTNDSEWAARITDPSSELEKVYHVQVSGLPGDRDLERMRTGIVDRGETLAVRKVHVLRSGEKNAWLEIVLDEGRNRQIRRVLSALDYEVLRLIRISIGPIELGSLAKGQWRDLTGEEVGIVPVIPAKAGIHRE